MYRHRVLKLLAPISADYNDKTLIFWFIPNIHRYVQKLLKKGEKCIYAQKTADVEYFICDTDELKVETYAIATYRNRPYRILEATNVAQKGDFVITKNGDLPRQYRMSISTAQKRYKFDAKKKKGIATPIEDVQCFIKIKKNIAFVSPWGSVMYLVKGGYLNITGHHIYAIQEYSFEHTYIVVDKSKN